jgi:hypothetical protein
VKKAISSQLSAVSFVAASLLAVLLSTGCATGGARIQFAAPDGRHLRIYQGKDVSFEGLDYNAATGHLTIKRYTSNANVAAMEAQMKAMQAVADIGYRAGLTAAGLPVPSVPSPKADR